MRHYVLSAFYCFHTTSPFRNTAIHFSAKSFEHLDEHLPGKTVRLSSLPAAKHRDGDPLVDIRGIKSGDRKLVDQIPLEECDFRGRGIVLSRLAHVGTPLFTVMLTGDTLPISNDAKHSRPQHGFEQLVMWLI